MDQETQRLEQASDWLIRLSEEDLHDSEITRWLEWCEADPLNRQAFERLLPLWQSVDGEQTQARRPFRAPTVPAEGGRRPGWLRRRGWIAMAASLLLGLGMIGLREVRRPVQLAPVSNLGSTVAEDRDAVLPDGSTLALGAKSSISIDFQGSGRRVDMGDGEAFFTVEHDRSRPFVVHAGGLQVVAVGTAFDVLHLGTRVVVTVQEGVVEMSAETGGGNMRPLRAPAGYQVVYDTARSASPGLRMVGATAATAWRQGRLEYFAEPLSSVIANLNRYSTTPIVLNDPALGSLAYTGTIQVRSIAEWLSALPRIFPVGVREERGRGFVIDARAVSAASRSRGGA